MRNRKLREHGFLRPIRIAAPDPKGMAFTLLGKKKLEIHSSCRIGFTACPECILALANAWRMSVVERFYTALAQRDWAAMGACYAEEARFSDPVFPDLDAAGVRAMWKMLLSSGTDLRVTFTIGEETGTRGRSVCDAFYTFSATGRPVHNSIHSTFELRDGLIFRQHDRFNFWRWSRQALGWRGLLLGWTPLVRNKVRATAAARLAKAMQR